MKWASCFVKRLGRSSEKLRLKMADCQNSFYTEASLCDIRKLAQAQNVFKARAKNHSHFTLNDTSRYQYFFFRLKEKGLVFN